MFYGFIHEMIMLIILEYVFQVTLDEMSSLSRAVIEICQDEQEMRYL